MRHQMSMDALALATRIFAEASFLNPDIGPLNEALDIDLFVISIPKCGTTAIQRGLERLGRKVIHAHTNRSTYAAFANGDILRSNGLGMETILQARLAANARPLHIFFGYREPVSWYLSLAGQFSLPSDRVSKTGISERIRTEHPWNEYLIEDISRMIARSVGIDILGHVFDHRAGFSLLRNKNASVFVYRFDKITKVRDYIVDYLDSGFVLTRERVNEDVRYLTHKASFFLSSEELEQVYNDRWFQHFYTSLERSLLIDSYSSPRSRGSTCPSTI